MKRVPRGSKTPRQQLFVRRLLRWYRTQGRPLPWRQTRDPYHILLSEVMLQQTQVDRVIPKYHEWLTRYPSIEDLARAQVRQVREAWHPLGYNARPLRLHAMARTIVAEHGGQVPADRPSLLRLKGIGPNTAGAVLSFAYGRREPILETNVRRVLRRVFYARPVPDAVLWRLAARLLPRRAYVFNQALMDLGAVVCVARRPRCAVCPMLGLCRTGRPVAARLGRRPAVIQGGNPR